MTNRKQTREVLLNEFVLASGIALGAAALGTGIAAAMKAKRIEKRIANPTATPKNAGLLGRVGQNIKNLGRMYKNKIQTDAGERLASMASDAHTQIAQKYMLKPQEYASAMAAHGRKQAVLGRLRSGGLANDPNLTNVGMQDIDDYITHRASGSAAAFTPRNAIGNDNQSISDYISTPSRIETLDAVNPAARQFREKMSKRTAGFGGILSPEAVAIRTKATRQINDRINYINQIRDTVRTDREEQIQQAGTTRATSLANIQTRKQQNLAGLQNQPPTLRGTARVFRGLANLAGLSAKSAFVRAKGLAGSKPLDVWNKR